MRLPIGISVLLSVLLLVFLVADAVRDSRNRRLTAEAIETANEWKVTSGQWERVAKEYERMLNQCEGRNSGSARKEKR